MEAIARRPTVLVVDDDARSREPLAAYLSPKYRVLSASGGAAALALLGSDGFDVVLLDVMMPGIDGFDTCRELKARTRGEYLPVVMLTALGEQEDRNTGLAAGADEFLTKPVDPMELALRVEVFLRIRFQEQVIRAQVREMQALDALKDELVSLIVHDVRNPLQSIVAYLSSIEQRARRSEERSVGSMARSCLAAANKVEKLLTDALDARRLEDGEMPMQREPMRLRSVVDDAVATLAGVAERRAIVVQVDVSDDVQLLADAGLVRRAIENLLVNALSYSPADRVVSIAASRRGDGAVVEVADRGPGVPDHLKRHIFEKFGVIEGRQAGRRRSHGLGLFFVSLVASRHGGCACVRDREGGGAIFELFLAGPKARGVG